MQEGEVIYDNEPYKSEPPKNNNTRNIIIAVVVLFILLCCCCACLGGLLANASNSGDFERIIDELGMLNRSINAAAYFC